VIPLKTGHLNSYLSSINVNIYNRNYNYIQTRLALLNLQRLNIQSMIIDINIEADGRIVPILGHREITMNESPFLIFLASAGMCSAVYVKAFCRQRKIPLDLVKVSQIMNYEPKANLVTAINIQLDLDEAFPEKYKEALKNVVALCPIKKHLITPPEFNVITESYLVNC